MTAGGRKNRNVQKEKQSRKVKRSRAKKGQEKTIQRQIFRGYFFFIGIALFLVAVSILMMSEIQREYEGVTAYQENQEQAQSVVAAHYKWLEDLSSAIATG